LGKVLQKRKYERENIDKTQINVEGFKRGVRLAYIRNIKQI